MIYTQRDVECSACGGEGEIYWPNSQDPASSIEICPDCNGMGWRAMTEDEEADAAEEQYRLMCEGEAPMSMQEAYEVAFRQKQELRS